MNESWYRENCDNYSHWNSVAFHTFSKDFFREFKYKFTWNTNPRGELTLVAIHVWKTFGDKFLKEMIGY